MSDGQTPQSDVIESSIVVRACRSLLRGIATAGPRAIRWFGLTNRRVAAGLRTDAAPMPDADDRVSALLHDSRIVRGMLSAVDVPIRAWHTSAMRRAVNDFLTLDLAVRFRLAGQALLAAVIAHTAILAALRVPVFALGWGTRGVLLLAGLALVVWPDVFAAAWADRASRRNT